MSQNIGQNLSTVKNRWYSSQTEQTCHQSEKDITILKQSQNLSPVRKRWYSTQTVPKTVPCQEKDGKYSNRATCHQSEKDVKYSTRAKTYQKSKKDGTILKQNKPVACQKRWYNTQTGLKPVTSQKKMVQY